LSNAQSIVQRRYSYHRCYFVVNMMLAALAGQLANKNFLVRPFTEN